MIYKDSRNLLNQQVRKQVVEEEDLFLDDEPEPGASQIPNTGICDEKPKAKKARAKKPFDTARLDVGRNTDDE